MIRRDNLQFVISDGNHLQTSDSRQTDLPMLTSERPICNNMEGVISKSYSKLHIM